MKSKFILLLLFFPTFASFAQVALKHCTDCGDKNCKCAYDVALSDSLQLTHIRKQFYKNASGHIYDKTFSATPEEEKVYFNGLLPQEVDPLTFEVLEGSWYARDKKNIYFYRPMSGGMHLFTMVGADYKSFRAMEEDSWNAMDKNHFYDMGNIVEGFYPKTTTVIRDKNGIAQKLIQGKSEYEFR
ncbi:MAG: DKNYY domain-containing protein [Flavobacterium sp.]|nr:DKNYY domain-containing protein [Flavobacterium sp.]